MAAMAPALTEAATEAHHRFKLATPSSSLSPPAPADSENGNPVNSNAKRKAFADDHGLDFRNNPRNEDRCKLQPLVPSYCCLDAASRPPPPPESVKLQASFSKRAVIKSHTILSHSLLDTGVLRTELLGGQPALEFSPGLLKTMNTNSTQAALLPPPQPPVNGLAKKSSAGLRQDSDLNNAGTGGKPLPSMFTSSGSNQLDDSGKLPTEVSNNNPMKKCVAGEQGNFSKEFSTSDEGLPKSQAPRLQELGGNGINTVSRSSTQVSASGVSGSTDGGKKCSVPRINPVSISTLDTEVHSRTLVAQARQTEIERRACRLRKRLEVVQAKQVERHVQQQLGGFVEKTLHKLPHLDCLKYQDGALRNQQSVFARKSDSAARKGGESTSETLANFFKSITVSKGLEKFVSSSDSKLRFTENAFDSDVTESSSGGESDIEEESLSSVEVEQYHTPLRQRSEWRWAVERAAIVSRWNWLQAHVSDLEYRIRQQTDIYRQIRANKGSIALGDSAPPDDSSRLTASNPDGVDCVSHNEVKANGPGSNPSSLPKILGKQVLLPIHPVENMTTCSTPTELTPTKPCIHPRPVNGVVNSVHNLLPDSSSTDSSDAEELLNKKQRLIMLPAPPDNTCVAARARPVLSCKKRRLVRPNNVQPLSRKVQRPLTVKCNCDVTTSCIMCGSRNPVSQEHHYDMPVSERLALLDPCLHPVLSFSDDIPLNTHFQPLLKGHWQNKPLERSKASKKLSLKHRGLLTGSLSDPSRKLANSILTSAKYSHNKNRTEKTFKQHSDDLLCVSKLGSSCNTHGPERLQNKKRQREHSAEYTEGGKLSSDMGYSSMVSSHSSSHATLMRQLSTSSENSSLSTSQGTGYTPQPVRRRRGESSFDINNIVIPMSVAATTRVEKLQYKEILTPSWRVVGVKADLTNHKIEEEDHEEIEDFSDAVIASRHSKCEEFERSRWTSWSASPISSQRRGSRSYKSTDGQSTPQPSNTNPSTPQSASPDVSFHSLSELPLTPSPHSPPAPPVSPDTLSAAFCSLSRENVRRISNEDTRCSTPDGGLEEQTVLPWEKRTFPLVSEPGTEREENPESRHRQTRNSRRASGSCKANKEAESSPPQPPPPPTTTLQPDCKQRHSLPLRLAHR
ncbi:KAT8 regulatory NSL complex subunit 1 [Callorhinchus milii]|nr:KAT8 regulatory NSL complex subunit 1 [Callorhinchus milii]XP_042199292.1 KAT8 regulatory NSL complex subunit 1 [Callorhinchus milii]